MNELERIYNDLKSRNLNIDDDTLRQKAWVLRDRLLFEKSSISNNSTSTSVGSGSGGGRLLTNNTTFTRLSEPIMSGSYLISGNGIVVSDGTYNKTATITYQWLRSGFDIVGENTNTYIPKLTDEGSEITCEVTATSNESTLTYITPPFILKAGLMFNTNLNSLDFGTIRTTGNDWTLKFKIDCLDSNNKMFFILFASTGNGIRFERQNFIFQSGGTSYSSNNTSGDLFDVRNFINGNHEWHFEKIGTVLKCYINGELLKEIVVDSAKPLSYRYFGRWSSNNTYDYNGLLEYLEIDGVRYDSLNNWGGITQNGVTKTQLYYGEMEDSFIVAGQSNAVARNDEEDNAYLGITFPIAKSKYWNNVALQYQDTIFGVNQASDPAGNWGVEYRNAFNLSEEGRQHYLLKYAIGGTSMASLWNSGIYTVAKIVNRSRRKMNNFIFIQGEADSTDLTLANAYETNLRNMILAFRKYCHYSNNTRFIILRLPQMTHPSYLYVDKIQAAQDAVAASLPNVEIITVPDNWNTLDGEHYDAPTIDSIGQKIFEQLQLRVI